MIDRLKKISLMKICCIILAICLIYPVGLNIARAAVSPESIVISETAMPAKAYGKIPADSGNVAFAECKDFIATIDTTTLDITVTDSKTGRVYHTQGLNENLPAKAKSPVVVTFMGEDHTTYVWDAYTHAVQNKMYSILKITDGVRLELEFSETETYRLYDHIPKYISINRYEKFFVDGLKKLTDDGIITEKEASKYRKALMSFYSKDTDKGYYYSKISGLPAVSVLTLLVKVTELVGYTTEELIADNDMYDIQTDIKEPASFTIIMDVTLSEDGITVLLPTKEQKSRNSYYSILDISVFPAFDCRYEAVNDGYIFVPDGSGMLIKLDSFNGDYPEYERAVYNNKLYDEKFTKQDFDEEVHMPVFGMYGTDAAGNTSGFMAVIESGAELSEIAVSLKSSNNDGSGGLYNSVYSKAQLMQFSMVRIYGPYDKDTSTYFKSTGTIKYDYKVKYHLYSEKAGYFRFAEDYREYLVKGEGINLEYDTQPKIFLEINGAFTVWDKVVGVPYDLVISMTNYNQAREIIDDLNGIPKVVNYRYVFNGGKMNTFPKGAALVGANGKKSNLLQLLKSSKKGQEIFLQADLMRVYKKTGIYTDKRFYALGYDGESGWKSSFTDEWAPDGTVSSTYKYSSFYPINPNYLSSAVNSFLKESDDFNNIALSDFGSFCLASYRSGNVIDPYTANQGAVLNNLRKLAEKKTLAVDNPNADKLAYCDYSLNVSRFSSDYGVSYTSIPFRQLVMNGITEYTTLDVNGAWDSSDAFLLQALELGAIPKFSVYYEKPDALMKGKIYQYYACCYKSVSKKIKSLAKEYETEFEKIGTKQITNHETLAPNVFRTTYKNGVTVLCNYNSYEVNTNEVTLSAFGYVIIPSNK